MRTENSNWKFETTGEAGSPNFGGPAVSAGVALTDRAGVSARRTLGFFRNHIWAGKRFWSVVWLGLLVTCLAAIPEPPPVEVEVLAQSTTSWDGTELPRYPRSQPEITILRILIPPHTALPLHKHPVINAGVLLRGSLTVVAESGRVLHLEAGDSIVELVNQWHYGRNDGDEPAEIIVFYAGTPGKPITVTRG
jgi:quercetin dioxygenase-like cupin family protein